MDVAVPPGTEERTESPYVARVARLYALLGELPDETTEERATWDRAYHKFLTLAAMADGESELAALAYADQHLAFWQDDRQADRARVRDDLGV